MRSAPFIAIIVPVRLAAFASAIESPFTVCAEPANTSGIPATNSFPSANFGKVKKRIEAAHGEGQAEHGGLGDQRGGLPRRLRQRVRRTPGHRRDRTCQKMQNAGRLAK